MFNTASIRIKNNNRLAMRKAVTGKMLSVRIAISQLRVLKFLVSLSHQIQLPVYLDDIVFSSNYNFKRFIFEIIHIIKSNGFSLNHKKISYRHDTCEVTGLFVGNGKVGIHPAMLKAARMNKNVERYVSYVQKCYKEYQISKI